jgi:hypothetical protein
MSNRNVNLNECWFLSFKFKIDCIDSALFVNQLDVITVLYVISSEKGELVLNEGLIIVTTFLFLWFFL